ncbi:hypothetical protein [Ruegeria arenilitoris]|uniref:hypothetical protein n=1 Tax=Ruegeria arenilitoris TaxID=1173585 RepID=UPI001480D7FC|nr:hypothetical protein [Ruegeria arenilitoris]
MEKGAGFSPARIFIFLNHYTASSRHLAGLNLAIAIAIILTTSVCHAALHSCLSWSYSYLRFWLCPGLGACCDERLDALGSACYGVSAGAGQTILGSFVNEREARANALYDYSLSTGALIKILTAITF